MVKENEDKKCECGPDCKCGCGCSCGCKCKKGALKILALVLVFLAGMGFDSLLHGCFRCPSKRMAPMHHGMTMPAKAVDTNVIIITPDGEVQYGHKKHHDKKFRAMKPEMNAEKAPAVETEAKEVVAEVVEETAPQAPVAE